MGLGGSGRTEVLGDKERNKEDGQRRSHLKGWGFCEVFFFIVWLLENEEKFANIRQIRKAVFYLKNLE